MTDYYQLLGVAPSASTAEIRQAYLRLARERHPDRVADPAGKQRAQAELQVLTTAFNTLVHERSRQEYDEALRRPPPQSPAEIARDSAARGLEALGAGQIEEAVRLLRTAVHHEPGNGELHAALGRALGRSPESAREAIQALERATQLAPRNVSAFVDLAALLGRQGLRLRAQKVLETAARLAPGDARIARLAADLGARPDGSRDS